MLFNNNVSHVSVHFSKFDVEQGWDWLKLIHNSGEKTFTGRNGVSGNTPPLLHVFYRQYPVKGGYFFPGNVDLNWYTDGSMRLHRLRNRCVADPLHILSDQSG